MEENELRDLIASNVATAVELRRTADAIGKLAAHYESMDSPDAPRSRISVVAAAKVMIAINGILTAVILVGWSAARSDIDKLKAQMLDVEVWQRGQEGITEVTVRALESTNEQLQKNGLPGIVPIIKDIKEKRNAIGTTLDNRGH